MIKVKGIIKTIRTKLHRNGHEPNAMLWVDATRKIIKRHIPDKKLPPSNLPVEVGKYSLHLLNMDRQGKLRPILVPREIKQNESPKDLWFALNCEQEVNEAYHMPEGLLSKLSYVAFFVLLFAELIVIFLIAASSMK